MTVCFTPLRCTPREQAPPKSSTRPTRARRTCCTPPQKPVSSASSTPQAPLRSAHHRKVRSKTRRHGTPTPPFPTPLPRLNPNAWLGDLRKSLDLMCASSIPPLCWVVDLFDRHPAWTSSKTPSLATTPSPLNFLCPWFTSETLLEPTDGPLKWMKRRAASSSPPTPTSRWRQFANASARSIRPPKHRNTACPTSSCRWPCFRTGWAGNLDVNATLHAPWPRT